jgi:pilus assembly protein FimV
LDAVSFSSVRALLILVATLCVSGQAFAAGLGRLQVQSALGAPFQAQINVIADKNELPSLSAKMAAPAAFQNAGLVFNNATASMRVALEKRPNGDPYVSITTAQPLNEPVVDLLIELSWSSGRVIREYTAFVDPPYLIAEREKQRAAAAAGPTTKPAPPQEAPKPEALPAEPAPEPSPAASAEPIPTTPTDVAEAPVSTEPPPQTAAAPATTAPEPPAAPVQTIGGTGPTLFDAETQTSAATGESYGLTKSGDTLSKIALSAKPADITLEQMLVLLFRSNPDAFSGKNMNRLKTGKIIRLPDASEYASVQATDARREVRLQFANFKEYRERLAAKAATSAEEPAQQAVSGQIAAQVEESKPATSEPKEVVKLSQGQAAPATSAGASKAAEEEVIARDKAVREANERVAKLEKSIKDLQALVEMKNQQMADLQRQAAGAPGATTQPPKPAASTSPAPSPPTAAKPAAPPSDATIATAPTAQAAPAQPAAPPAASPTPGPAPGQPKAPQVRARPAPPPPPPPSLVDQILEEPLYLAAGGLFIVIMGLLAVRSVRRRREAKAEAEEVAPAGSVFASAGAAAATTFAATQSDTGARTRDIAEEVDPLEEAEIFLAYGRDAQAEELLKEAMRTPSRRNQAQLKLLEIYAKRHDAAAFEQLARDLQQGTGGHGELWERAMQLGYELDPGNPRYAAGRDTQPGAHDTAEPGPAEHLDLDVGLGDDTTASTTSTDIDLDSTSHFEKTQIFSVDQLSASPGTEPAASNVDLNIDLPVEGGASEPAPASNAIEFDFDISKLSATEPAPAAGDSTEREGGLDFDVGTLSLEPGAGKSESASNPAIDLSGISLDLEGATTSPTASSMGKDEKWYEVQTKFDLAKAYQEMGDKDGAREILKEVIAEGDADQKAAAQAVLTALD